MLYKVIKYIRLKAGLKAGLILTFIIAFSPLLDAQLVVPKRDLQPPDSLNRTSSTALPQTTIKKGYTIISRSNGRYYHTNLKRYILDSIPEISNTAGNDSVYVTGDSVCVISIGDTICVSQDSFYMTDTTLCVITMGDTLCSTYTSGTGINIYNSNGTLTANRTMTMNGKTLKIDNSGGTLFFLNPNQSSPGSLLLLQQSLILANQNLLQLNNTGSNTNSDAFMLFQAQGTPDKKYTLGVDRSISALVMGEGNDLSTDPVYQYYGGGDSLVFRKDIKIRASLRDYYNSIGSTNQVLINDGGGHVQWSNLAAIFSIKLNEVAASSNITYPLADHGNTKIRWGWNTISNDTAMVWSSTSISSGSLFNLWSHSISTGSMMTLKSSSLTTGSLLSLTGTGTTAATGVGLLNINYTGANASSAQTSKAIVVNNARTGTASITYGGYFTASGGAIKNVALFASASGGVGVGYGIYGQSTGVGTAILGENTSLGNGVEASVLGTTAIPLYAKKDASDVNNIVDMLVLDRRTTGTPTDNIGGQIRFANETTTTPGVTSNSISSRWANPVHAARISQLVISGTYNGVVADILGLGDDGGLTGFGTAGTVRFFAYPNTRNDGVAINLFHSDGTGNVACTPIDKIFYNSTWNTSGGTFGLCGYYTFYGTGALSWSLPAVAASTTGNFYYVKNRSTANVTIGVAGGASTIYLTAAVATYTVLPGEGFTIHCDGTYWNIQ